MKPTQVRVTLTATDGTVHLGGFSVPVAVHAGVDWDDARQNVASQAALAVDHLFRTLQRKEEAGGDYRERPEGGAERATAHHPGPGR